MAKTTYIADKFTVINTQGIRFVEKTNSNSYSTIDKFTLRVTYKGSALIYSYALESDRDNQYNNLVNKLTNKDT